MARSGLASLGSTRRSASGSAPWLGRLARVRDQKAGSISVSARPAASQTGLAAQVGPLGSLLLPRLLSLPARAHGSVALSITLTSRAYVSIAPGSRAAGGRSDAGSCMCVRMCATEGVRVCAARVFDQMPERAPGTPCSDIAVVASGDRGGMGQQRGGNTTRKGGPLGKVGHWLALAGT